MSRKHATGNVYCIYLRVDTVHNHINFGFSCATFLRLLKDYKRVYVCVRRRILRRSDPLQGGFLTYHEDFPFFGFFRRVLLEMLFCVCVCAWHWNRWTWIKIFLLNFYVHLKRWKLCFFFHVPSFASTTSFEFCVCCFSISDISHDVADLLTHSKLLLCTAKEIKMSDAVM